MADWGPTGSSRLCRTRRLPRAPADGRLVRPSIVDALGIVSDLGLELRQARRNLGEVWSLGELSIATDRATSSPPSRTSAIRARRKGAEARPRAAGSERAASQAIQSACSIPCIFGYERAYSPGVQTSRPENPARVKGSSMRSIRTLWTLLQRASRSCCRRGRRGGSLTVSPPVDATVGNPLAGCPPDGSGTNFPDAEVEPWVEVNPTNNANVVAIYQQDRYSNGGAKGTSPRSAFDGGVTWTHVAVPNDTRCTGGQFQRSSDPWLSFGPDGTLHAMSLVTDPMSARRSAPTG